MHRISGTSGRMANRRVKASGLTPSAIARWSPPNSRRLLTNEVSASVSPNPRVFTASVRSWNIQVVEMPKYWFSNFVAHSASRLIAEYEKLWYSFFVFVIGLWDGGETCCVSRAHCVSQFCFCIEMGPEEEGRRDGVKILPAEVRVPSSWFVHRSSMRRKGRSPRSQSVSSVRDCERTIYPTPERCAS